MNHTLSGIDLPCMTGLDHEVGVDVSVRDLFVI